MRKLYKGIRNFFLILLFSINLNSQNPKIIKLYSKLHKKEIEIAANEIIVKFKEKADIEKINNTILKKLKKSHKNLNKNTHRIIIEDNADISKIIELYRNHPEVTYAEPNYIAKSFLIIPNDPLFQEQWGINKIKAPEAWELTNPKRKVIVALIDTGVELSNIELADKITQGYDFIENDTEPQDDNGHGTHCAGIIAANINNEIGISGITNSAVIMPIKALDKNGIGFYSDIAEAIVYAADNGAHIINLSLGGTEPSYLLQEAIDYAYNKGCVIVAAAGNLGNATPVYPAAFPNVIAVGATDENDKRWGLSSYGDFLDVVAPGVNILSTYLGNTYRKATGTSASSAFVSAVAAFIVSNSIDIKNYEVENLIFQNVDDLGNNGKDIEYGYGRINMLNAIKNTSELQHDISITGILISSTNPINKEVDIKVYIINQGKNEEKNILLKTEVDEKEIFNNIIDKIQPDEKIEINIKLNKDISTLEQLLIKTEVLPVIGEKDLNDNIKTVLFKVNYDTNTNAVIFHETDVHSYIIEEALKIWPNDTSNEVYIYKDELHRGAGNYGGGYTYSEDGNADYYGNLYICTISVSEHFWDPYNPNYVAWWNLCAPPYSPSTARTRALYIWNNYVIPNYPSNKNKAYYYLGRVIHLLEDMSVPAHVAWDQHTALDKDTYESIYILSNYSNYKATGTAVIKSDINSYFESMAKITRKYPSDDYDGYADSEPFWYNNNGNLSNTNGSNASLNNSACQTIASELMPSAMQHVAGVLKLFAETLDNTPPSSPANLDDGISGWNKSNTITFSWSASTDNLSGVKGYYYSLTDSTPDNDDFFTTELSTTISNLPEGIYTFYVSAVDNSISQNISTPTSHTFMIDIASPTILNNQNGDNVWRRINDGIYDVDFEDNISYLNKFQIKITTGLYQTGAEIIPWTDIITDINSSSYTTNWQIPNSIFDLIPNGTSYVSIRAYDNAGNYSEINAFYIKKDTTPPDIAVLIYPENNSILNSNSINFNWIKPQDTFSGIYGYEIEISTTEEFSIIYSSSFSDVENKIFFLEEGKRYYWKLKTVDNAGNYSPYSEVFNILIDTTPPTSPILTNPANHYITNDTDISFNWTTSEDNVSGISGYEIIISTKNNFEVIFSSEFINNTNIIKSIPSNNYYWKVRSKDMAGNYSNYSNTFEIIIDTIPPSNPKKVTTQSGAQDNTWQNYDNQPIFSWEVSDNENGSGVNGYYVYIGTNPYGTSS